MKTINKLTPPNLPLSLREGKKGNRNKKAFTLVELIIVITILAILATIAFVSFQNYTKDARDGNRITTLKNIESGLTLYNIKSNKYPDPEEYIEILSGNILLIKQGIVGNDIAQKIKLNKEAKDPKDKTNYIYSITGNGKKYQLGTYLEENKLISYIPQITKTYANVDYSKRYFYTMGDLVGILIDEDTKQTISLQTYPDDTLDLTTNSGSFIVYFSNDAQSGSYTSSGTNLIEKIVENQKTTTLILSEDNKTPGISSCTGVLPNNSELIGPNTLGNYNYNTNDTISCAYNCIDGYHTEDGGVTCISNTKQESCNQNGKPENSSYIISDVDVVWNGTDWNNPNDCEWTCSENYTKNGSSCDINTYTISGSFGANANGATINVCETNVIADASGNFTRTGVPYGTNCSNISATRANYTCTTSTQGPASLTSNFTTVAGSCNSSMTYMTISTNTKEFNLYTYLGNPTTPINMEVTINAGIYVWSSNTSIPAFNTGNLPPGSNVILINNGYIMGKGGNGGGNGQNGFPGGAAINLGANISINNTNGFIGGGGGGGGGGGSSSAGGGGGAGGGNGGASFLTAGGAGGSIGNIGSNGIPTDDGMQYWVSGGGGGRVFPGTSGAGTFGGGAGGGGGYIDSGAGGAGGGGNNIGSPGKSNTYWNGGGGGGGWGASGGAGKGYAYADRPGGAGGKAIVLNGYGVTWLSGTSQVYGAVN